MKKLFLIALLSSMTFITSFAQNDSNFVIPKNDDLTSYTNDGFKITASDVYSKLSEFKRKIEIFDNNNNPFGVAYIKLVSANSDENIYDKIKNDPNNFSGTLTIEVDDLIVYSNTITNGIAASNRTPEPFYNGSLSCTISTVHDCVSYSIDEMNWVEYTVCLAAAPGCYIEQWLSCQWEVCHNHMQYTNPFPKR